MGDVPDHQLTDTWNDQDEREVQLNAELVHDPSQIDVVDLFRRVVHACQESTVHLICSTKQARHWNSELFPDAR